MNNINICSRDAQECCKYSATKELGSDHKFSQSLLSIIQHKTVKNGKLNVFTKVPRVSIFVPASWISQRALYGATMLKIITQCLSCSAKIKLLVYLFWKEVNCRNNHTRLSTNIAMDSTRRLYLRSQRSVDQIIQYTNAITTFVINVTFHLRFNKSISWRLNVIL